MDSKFIYKESISYIFIYFKGWLNYLFDVSTNNKWGRQLNKKFNQSNKTKQTTPQKKPDTQTLLHCFFHPMIKTEEKLSFFYSSDLCGKCRDITTWYSYGSQGLQYTTSLHLAVPCHRGGMIFSSVVKSLRLTRNERPLMLACKARSSWSQSLWSPAWFSSDNDSYSCFIIAMPHIKFESYLELHWYCAKLRVDFSSTDHGKHGHW